MTETENGVKLRQATLASAFRNRMTEGQSYQGPNAYRKEFYKRVIQLANDVSFRGFLILARMTIFKSSRKRTPGNRNWRSLTRKSLKI